MDGFTRELIDSATMDAIANATYRAIDRDAWASVSTIDGIRIVGHESTYSVVANALNEDLEGAV